MKGWRTNVPASRPSTPLGFAEHLKMPNSFYTLGYLPPASPVLQASAKPDPAAGVLHNQIVCSIYALKYILFRPKPLNMQLKW